MNGTTLTVVRDDVILRTPTAAEIERAFARSMAERLVQSALMADSRDNISVMVVLLPGSGVSSLEQQQ